jgi:citrate synthase
MASAPYLSAQQAAALLGVTLPTLYAYVSRGLLRSEPVPGRPRERRYRQEDVTQVGERKEVRGDPAKLLARGLHWGGPLLDSAIALIDGGRLYYRGREAVALAREARVEEVAALLWTGDPAQADALFATKTAPLPRPLRALIRRAERAGLGATRAIDALDPLSRCQIALPLAGATDLRAFDLRPAAVAATGARILDLLVATVAGRPATRPLESALQAAWAAERPAAARALRAALILCADHELNASTFTVRCVASAAATPYDAVAAGLAALKGARHGGATAQAGAFLREVGTPGAARAALSARLRRGEGVPGFGHALYPQGDPRGRALLELAREMAPRSRAVALAAAVCEETASLLGEAPNLDFGLAVLAAALDLPEASATALFALGRTMGWIGHALEQYADPRLIRPRARYVGEAPA